MECVLGGVVVLVVCCVCGGCCFDGVLEGAFGGACGGISVWWWVSGWCRVGSVVVGGICLGVWLVFGVI